MSENTVTPAPHQVTVEVGGRPLILETGKIAKQANGAITARYGDTIVLTTACMASQMNDRDFLPLTVDYRENTYSAGKIPGGFFKREGRPSEKEVLTSRLIDRPMRPLFPESWRNETQIVSLVLSADSENDPDVIAVTSASAAAYCSDLPFEKPIACVRVGLLDGQLVGRVDLKRTADALHVVGAFAEDGQDRARVAAALVPELTSMATWLGVDDVTVGSVSGISAEQRADGSFYAAVKVALNKNVDLPANATATVAQWSGRGLARNLALHLDRLPRVILDTKERLFLHSPGVEELRDDRLQTETLYVIVRGVREPFSHRLVTEDAQNRSRETRG